MSMMESNLTMYVKFEVTTVTFVRIGLFWDVYREVW
jgi:hypothetical protein